MAPRPPLHELAPLLGRPPYPAPVTVRFRTVPRHSHRPQTLHADPLFPTRLVVTLTRLPLARRKDAQQRCSTGMLDPDAQRRSAGGGHSQLSSPASGAAPAPRLPCPGSPGRGGARPGRAVEEGRAQVRKDDTVAEGWLRFRPDFTWMNPPGPRSLVPSACRPELVERQRSPPSFCSLPVLLLLKGPCLPTSDGWQGWRCREQRLQRGGQKGRFCEPRTELVTKGQQEVARGRKLEVTQRSRSSGSRVQNSSCPEGWEAVSLSARTNPSLLISSSSALELNPTQS